ncbi:hypothetical protein CSC68_02135 [Pseudoxanthomonas suwonensis]|nr:hypothetical protein CSC68_02135 [Pseudoxanthomonas suwonensis]
MLRHNRGMPDFGPARHLPAHHHTRERWHNGAGWTRRILRLPAGDGWALSLSIADIEETAAYSCLPGVQREQVLLSGDGLRLEFTDGEVATLLPPHQRIRFAGDRGVTGVPLDGPPVRAFNAMWRPDMVDVTLLHRPLVGGMFCFCDVDTAWAVYLLGGSARVSAEGEDFRLDGGDGAWLAAPGRRRFVLDGAGEALLLRVQRTGTGLAPAQ